MNDNIIPGLKVLLSPFLALALSVARLLQGVLKILKGFWASFENLQTPSQLSERLLAALVVAATLDQFDKPLRALKGFWDR